MGGCKMTLTYEQAIESFKYSHETYIESKKDDVIALKTAWNDYTHFLLDDEEITEEQYNNWDNPF